MCGDQGVDGCDGEWGEVVRESDGVGGRVIGGCERE